jgi:plastocyanin
MSAPRIPLLAASIAAIAALAFAVSCSKKDSSSPQLVVGPTFNFTFAMTGTSHTRVFTEVGTWNYRCVSHNGMNGTVTVDAGSANDSALVQVGASGNTFSPAAVTIRTNGSVRWVNASGLPNHTVTR